MLRLRVVKLHRHERAPAAASLIALAAFLCGARAGGWLVTRRADHRGHLLRAASGGQAPLIAIALLLALLATAPLAEGVRYALIALLALAMGVQNAAAQQLAVADLTTTVLTRTLTGLASDVGHAGGPNPARRIVAVAAMLLGALAGGVLVLDVSLASALALALAVFVGLAAHLASRSDGAWSAALVDTQR